MHTAVVTALTATLPELREADLPALLAAAGAAKGIPLRELAEHLTSHPDALTSGDPRCPAVVVRLTHVLHAAGQTTVVRPGCAGCSKVTADLSRPGPDGRICQMCWVHANRATCARCGRTAARIAARRAEGGICYGCYRTDPGVVQECGRCGRTRMPVARGDDGAPLCLGCWTPPAHRCIVCGGEGPAAVTGPDGATCRACYRRDQQPRRVCGRCGRTGPVAKRATPDSPDLCYSCNLGPEQVCAACGRVRPSRRWAGGAWRCHACRPRHSEACCRCGRCRPVHARWPIGPVCATCHAVILDAPADCARCHQRRVLIACDEAGAPTCGPCAGLDVDPRCCVACGRPGRHYTPGKCAHCVLDDRLRALLAGPDGEVASQLWPVQHAFAAAQHPRSLIRWPQRSPSAKLLGQLAATGQPLTHDLLDELAPGRHEYHLRQVLVHTGVLAERHDDLERLPAWLEQTLAGKPAEHARLIRPFVHWFLLRRARRRAATRRHPATAGSYLRTRITVALRLLAWLDEHHLPLDRLDQASLDAWLAGGNTSHYTIRDFLDWAAARGPAPRLTVPSLPRQDPEQILDDTQRWAQLRRCLTDETMPLDTRAAAALALLYGLPLSRIRHLTVDQLNLRGTRSFLHRPAPAAAATAARRPAATTRRHATDSGQPRQRQRPGTTTLAVPRPHPRTADEQVRPPAQAARLPRRRSAGPQRGAHLPGRRPSGPGAG